MPGKGFQAASAVEERMTQKDKPATLKSYYKSAKVFFLGPKKEKKRDDDDSDNNYSDDESDGCQRNDSAQKSRSRRALKEEESSEDESDNQRRRVPRRKTRKDKYGISRKVEERGRQRSPSSAEKFKKETRNLFEEDFFGESSSPDSILEIANPFGLNTITADGRPVVQRETFGRERSCSSAQRIKEEREERKAASAGYNPFED